MIYMKQGKPCKTTKERGRKAYLEEGEEKRETGRKRWKKEGENEEKERGRGQEEALGGSQG